MRKSVLVICAVATIMLLSGCFIQSLNQFCTEDAVIDFPAASGQWKFVRRGDEDLSGNYTEPWIFSEDAIETYEDGVKSVLNAKYFMIGDDIFVDLYPAEPREGNKPNDWWVAHVMPVHSVCRVNIAGNTLALTPLDGGWVAGLIEKKELKLSFVSRGSDDDELLLTASSKDLMAFLAEYKDEPKAFPKGNSHFFEKQ